MTLGEKIQKLRKQRGLSQEALAEKVTVTRQTISKWELGQSTPDLDFIAQLSDIFNVSSDYLIKDEMIEPDELLYKKRSYHLSERGKRIILVVVSAAALIVVIDCCCFNYSCMAYVASKSDFQNKDRFENLSCSQCYPFSATGNIVFAFEKVSYIHVGRLHNADCDCCNLDNVYNFPQVQKKLVAGIWLCPAGFNTSTDCNYSYYSLFFTASPV